MKTISVRFPNNSRRNKHNAKNVYSIAPQKSLHVAFINFSKLPAHQPSATNAANNNNPLRAVLIKKLLPVIAAFLLSMAGLHAQTFAISGTVFSDANGLTDNTVNGTGSNGGSAALKAVLVNTVTNKVVAISTVSAANGIYSFTNQSAGNYNVLITTNTATVGSAPPAVALPAGYVSTGEKLGTGTGSDGTPDGILALGSISAATSNVRFGIERTPTANNVTGTTQQNPGGNYKLVTVVTLTGSDPDDGTYTGTSGTDDIIIQTLPANATLYYNGTAVTAGQTITNYNPGLLTIDPNTGVTSVAFTYSEKDAAGVASTAATATMPFTTPVAFTCSNLAYQVANGTFYSFDVNTGIRTAIKVLGIAANNIGYSVADNLIYGWSATLNKVIRLDANGDTTSFTIPNLSATGFGTGDVLPGGYLVLMQGSAANTTFYTIDVNPSHTNFMQLVDPTNSYALQTGPGFGTAMSTGIAEADFSYNPVTGLLTGIVGPTDPTNPFKIGSLNPATGAVTFSSTAVTGSTIQTETSGFGATFIDSKNNNILYVFANAIGNFYSVNISSNTATLLSTSTPAGSNDGASCPTATLSYTISGAVYNDVNGVSDNTVNGTAYAGATALNAILYDNTTGLVAAVSPVSTGAYSFNATPGDNYTVYVTTNTATVGSATVPTVALPAGYVSTGENLGGGTGSDGTANSILPIGILSANTTNANFGVDQIPTGTNQSAASQANPGVGQAVAFSTTVYNGTDAEDGTYGSNLAGRQVKLFAANGSNVLYYNGQAVASSTLVTNFNPSLVAMSPSVSTAVSTTFTYQVYDNALQPSAAITVTVPFTAPARLISGNMWLDANIDAVKQSSESLTGTSSGIMYANLVNGSNVVVQSVLLNGGNSYNYSLAGASNTAYKVIITYGSQAVGATLSTSSITPGYVNTGVNLGGTANTGNKTGIISIAATPGNVTNQNFGVLFCAGTTLSITASASAGHVCASASPATTITLTSTPSGGLASYSSYVWSGSGIGTTNIQNTTATPTATTTYSVTVTDALGCTATSSTASVTYDVVTPNIAYTCGTNSNGVKYVLLNENNGTSWLWTTANGSRFYSNIALDVYSDGTTSTQQLTYIVSNGTYTVQITDAAGCSGSAGITITNSSCPAVLAIGTLELSAVKQNNIAVLNWSAASENTTSYFNVERSSDGLSWATIANLKAARRSSATTGYNFTDTKPLNGTNFYRITAANTNGSVTYSSVKQLQFNGVQTLKVYPNPVQTTVNLDVASERDEKAEIIVTNMAGSKMFSTAYQLIPGLNHIVLNQVQQLAQGSYLITVLTKGNTLHATIVKAGR